jgi:hypothetical protein
MLLPSNKVQLSRGIQRCHRATQSPYYNCYKATPDVSELCGNDQTIAADLSSRKVHTENPTQGFSGCPQVSSLGFSLSYLYSDNPYIQDESIEEYEFHSNHLVEKIVL